MQGASLLYLDLFSLHSQGWRFLQNISIKEKIKWFELEFGGFWNLSMVIPWRGRDWGLRVGDVLVYPGVLGYDVALASIESGVWQNEINWTTSVFTVIMYFKTFTNCLRIQIFVLSLFKHGFKLFFDSTWHTEMLVRERFKIKNTIICGESPKGGGGVRAKIKKVYISNVDFFDFGPDPPPFWTFSTNYGIFYFEPSPKQNLSLINNISL